MAFTSQKNTESITPNQLKQRNPKYYFRVFPCKVMIFFRLINIRQIGFSLKF